MLWIACHLLAVAISVLVLYSLETSSTNAREEEGFDSTAIAKQL